MRKPTMCIGENKGADQLAVTLKLISAFVFAARIVQFLFFLNPNPKFQAYSQLLGRFVSDLFGNHIVGFPMGWLIYTVYIRAYAEQTVTERTDVYRSTRFFAPKMFCTVFHPKLYASNVLLYRPCMSIYYFPKHHNFRHGSLVV